MDSHPLQFQSSKAANENLIQNVREKYPFIFTVRTWPIKVVSLLVKIRICTFQKIHETFVAHRPRKSRSQDHPKRQIVKVLFWFLGRANWQSQEKGDAEYHFESDMSSVFFCHSHFLEYSLPLTWVVNITWVPFKSGDNLSNFPACGSKVMQSFFFSSLKFILQRFLSIIFCPPTSPRLL